MVYVYQYLTTVPNMMILELAQPATKDTASLVMIASLTRFKKFPISDAKHGTGTIKSASNAQLDML